MIKQLTVRIYDENDVAIGSGSLFIPKTISLFAYVYTAAHVVTDKELVKFKSVIDEHEYCFESIDKDSIKCHDKFEDSEVKKFDTAVIKVKREEWMNKLPSLILASPSEGKKIEGRGFPRNTYDSNLQMAMLPLEGTVGMCSEQEKRFHISLNNNLDSSDRNDELKGYSGSGIYIKSTRDNLELIGIFSYGQGQNAIQGVTNAFSIELIKDICIKYKWELPEDSMEVPSSFIDYKEDAINIIENEEIKRHISLIIDTLTENKIIPSTLVHNKSQIYDIPQCVNNNRMRCKECWIARLQLICILAILGVSIEDLNEPQIKIGNSNIPIDFFCSEGKKGNSTLGGVVRSILTSGYLWDNNLRENAILIWASKGKQTRKFMPKSKFKNVISDICNETASRINRYDTMYGEGRANNLSIIHIDKIMEAVDCDEKKDVYKNVMEVLNNAIK